MTPPAEASHERIKDAHMPRTGAPQTGAPPARTPLERGMRLYDATALTGVLVTFAAPVLALVAGASPLTAGSLGYAGILLFAGGIAARYGFAEHPIPLLQLGKNLGVAAIVTGVFYLVFLLIMLV